MSWKLVLATIFGVIWMAAVLVAWFCVGLWMDSDAYWTVMWVPAIFTAASPFIVGAVLTVAFEEEK